MRTTENATRCVYEITVLRWGRRSVKKQDGKEQKTDNMRTFLLNLGLYCLKVRSGGSGRPPRFSHPSFALMQTMISLSHWCKTVAGPCSTLIRSVCASKWLLGSDAFTRRVNALGNAHARRKALCNGEETFAVSGCQASKPPIHTANAQRARKLRRNVYSLQQLLGCQSAAGNYLGAQYLVLWRILHILRAVTLTNWYQCKYEYWRANENILSAYR